MAKPSPPGTEGPSAETTGHEWDGIEELNTPLPRWWVWVFYATVLWAVGYWILMPAWPLIDGYTRGLLGWSQREVLEKKMAAARAAQADTLARIRDASLEEIRTDPDLLSFALGGGRSAFAVNCSPCHGRGAQGGPGYPNLNDDAWLWGGSLEAIHTTLRTGIRAGHEETRVSQMPGFLADQILDRDQVIRVAEYVLSLSGRATDPQAAEAGRAVFQEQCAVCHGEDAKGMKEVGAPDLTDAIWLYGSDRTAVIDTISYGRGGVMPSWEDRLQPETLKMLAVYVHSLGGGQ